MMYAKTSSDDTAKHKKMRKQCKNNAKPIPKKMRRKRKNKSPKDALECKKKKCEKPAFVH